MNLFEHIRLALESIHPCAPWLALPLVSFVVTWAMRRYTPTLWVTIAAWGPPGGTIGHVTQALPGALGGAAAVALGTGGDLGLAVFGAFATLIAPLLHHAAKASPRIPYRGALGKPVDGPTSRRLVGSAITIIKDEFEKL